MRDNAAGVANIHWIAFTGILTKQIAQALESNKVYSCLVAMGAITNKALVPLEKTGKYKSLFLKWSRNWLRKADWTAEQIKTAYDIISDGS
jgi:hypothetical protein